MKHILGFLSTPPLWNNEQFGIPQFEFPELDLEGFEPKFIPENLRLGHKVEYIFKQLIDFDPTYAVLAHNQQLKRDNITIGELDFLLRHNTTRQVHHVELTYKFYILDPTISEPIHRAMGPNRKDQFFVKMEKTRDRQFPLLYSTEGKATLEDLDISEETIKQSCCFLAQLFIPHGNSTLSINPLNKECIAGSWLRLVNLSEEKFSGCVFYFPLKYEWLHIPHSQVTWLSYVDCHEEVYARHLNNRSPMIWIKHPNNRLEKCFVVWW